jgi:tetratricopeptide (TPR) repeat protein
MSFLSKLSRLIGSLSSSAGRGDVEGRLARFEAEAENATAGYVGSSYNKAGDLALKEGQRDRAVAYYGRAIDAFLEDAQREAARGVANKIIRVRPSAVRTLCTLTWLDLAAQHDATALLHLRDYTSAAREAGQHSRAATQIYEMASIAPESEFVEAVADALDGLDFSNRAREVRGWAGTGSPKGISDRDELSEACLLAAVRSNDRDAVLLSDCEDEDAGVGDSSDEDDPAPALEEGLGDEARLGQKKYRWD